MRYDEMIDFLKKNDQEMVVQITTRTEVKMNKKDVATKKILNPFGIVYKTSKIKVKVNFDYQNEVNEQLKVEGKEQTFEAQERKWGEHIAKSIIEKGSQLYLSVIEIDKIGKSTYRENDQDISYEELKPFIPEYKSSNKILENEVKYRNYKLENIIDFEVIQ